MTCWRSGRKNSRTIYIQTGPAPADSDVYIGSLDTPELAALAVRSVNERLRRASEPRETPQEAPDA